MTGSKIIVLTAVGLAAVLGTALGLRYLHICRLTKRASGYFRGTPSDFLDFELDDVTRAILSKPIDYSHVRLLRPLPVTEEKAAPPKNDE